MNDVRQKLCCRKFTLKYALVDDPITYKNAPISIQLVGKTLEEEAVIAMSEIVDNALKANPSVVRAQL